MEAFSGGGGLRRAVTFVFTRTILLGARSGNAKASSPPTLAYTKDWPSRDTEAIGLRGPNSRSRARGVIDGIGSPIGRLRSHGIHSFESVSEESRPSVRFDGSSDCNSGMSSR